MTLAQFDSTRAKVGGHRWRALLGGDDGGGGDGGAVPLADHPFL